MSSILIFSAIIYEENMNHPPGNDISWHEVCSNDSKDVIPLVEYVVEPEE